MKEERKAYIQRIKECDGKSIYIYGAGKVGKIVLRICKNSNIPVRGVVVTKQEYNVGELDGIPVIQYDHLECQKQDSVILIGFLERGIKQLRDRIISDGWFDVIEVPENILLFAKEEVVKHRNPTLEITVRIGCKVDCRFCPQRGLLSAYYSKDKNRKAVMSLEDFKACINKLPKQTLIEFAGFAEPFLNSNCVDMILYAYEKGFEMTLYTTLVGLTKDKLALIEHIPFKQVILHVADNCNFANIEVTDEYLELLEYMVSLKREDGTRFVTGANCQAEPHSKVVERLKGKIKIYCELTDRAGNIEEKGYELAHADKIGALKCAKSMDLNHNVLLPDGTVVLCCNDFGLQHELGNLLQSDYSYITDGEGKRNIRSLMLEEKAGHLICRKCICAQNI